MVCMIFIVHTIAAAQHVLKMCSPDAYTRSAMTSLLPARRKAAPGSALFEAFCQRLRERWSNKQIASSLGKLCWPSRNSPDGLVGPLSFRTAWG